MFSRSHGLGLDVFCFPVGVYSVGGAASRARRRCLRTRWTFMHFPKMTQTTTWYDQSPKLNDWLRYIREVQRIQLPPFNTHQANIMPSELAAGRPVHDSG